MALGRISGPLLAKNLFRNDVDIAFYNNSSTTEDPILYLNVTDAKVGIRKDNPQYSLDVKGTINGDVLRILETPGQGGVTGIGTIGKIFISTNTISSLVGPVNIRPFGGDDINLQSNVTVSGDLHATGNITADGDIGLGDKPTDKITIKGKIDSDLIPSVDNTYNIGSSTSTWSAGYVQELITSKISSQAGSIVINPNDGLLEINGQIRVNSPNRPLGTAPVVTNVLYVTMDGDDTNDGAAMDESRACRTISGATKSPLYRPGTAIKVAAGRYYENNPIEMLPNTSVIGSDLRTTFIEPVNKTQDLFHVRSGCYIAQLQMSNGRSGLLPIENANGYNRGAYATAFPPQGDDGEKIDVFHSPYIQNCTNQSGPWLKDGTMFVPNQTIQIPKAVGMGSWQANTTTLLISLTTGTISVGDSINTGQQNLGFYDARTLILANKAHIQEQVINWINYNIATATTSSIWYGFSYARAKCYRDVGIILENVSYDTTFGGNQKSVESGLAYYQGVISLIAGQERQTVAAINYINSLTQKIIVNNTNTLYGSVTAQQVINPNLKGGAIAGPTFANNISVITDIILRGPNFAPTIYEGQGPDKQSVSAEVLLQTNRTFIQNEVTAWTDYNYSSINYSQDKCKRDLGLIVDAICLDSLYNNNYASQSTFAGLQYWKQSSYTGQIANELTTTTNAIRYVRDLCKEVIQNVTTGVRYQNTVTQVTNLVTGSASEATIVNNEFNLILDVIVNGTIGVTDRIIPNNFYPSTTQSVVNSYNIIQANKSYIIAEAISFVEQNKTQGFTYDQNLCGRDVGYMLDSVCFDLLHGGNKQAIQSGVYYYSFNGSSSIANEVPQTTFAYNTLTNIVSQLVQNIEITPLQNKVQQNLSLPAAGVQQATDFETLINYIISIITTGPSAANAKTPIILTRTQSINIENAVAILSANKEFIKEEVIARVNNQFFKQHSYNQDKCYRDAGLIVDAVVLDLLFPTADNSQSTFAGLQYWNNSSSVIPGQITTTTNSIIFARDLCKKIIVNDATPINRWSTGTQITSLPGSVSQVGELLAEKFDAMLDIINNGTSGVTDKIIPNDIEKSINIDIQQAADILMANKAYIQQEVVSWVDGNKTAGWTYDRTKCLRDAGYIIDCVTFDLLYGGNKQSIQGGVYYYGFNAGSSAIYGQTTATIAAYNRIYSIIPEIIKGQAVESYQTDEKQIFNVSTNNTTTIATAVSKISIITNIISNGPTVAAAPSPITIYASTSTDVLLASQVLQANRQFIQAETVAYVNQFFAFDYNRTKCSRDAGYIVDAVTQDLILGGTTKAIESGISYWMGARSYIAGQIPQTVGAVNRAKDIALDIIQNKQVSKTSGNGVDQIINTYFDGGKFATDKIINSFDVITKIMQNGPSAAPDSFVGSGLFPATGISNNDTKIAPKITSVTSFTYDETLCRRDLGLIIDNSYYDILLGTNYNAVLSGLAYKRATASSQFVINYELTQTTKAYEYVSSRSSVLLNSNSTAVDRSDNFYSELQQILAGDAPSTVTFTNPVGGSLARVAAKDQLIANKQFIQSETVTWIQSQIDQEIGDFAGFSYNSAKCFRDVGFIVDALCYDILYGGNSASRYIAKLYFTDAGVNTIAGESSQSVLAFQHMASVASDIIQGNTVTPTPGTDGYQIKVGSNATASEASLLQSLIQIITDVITAGNLSGLPALSNPGTGWVNAGIGNAAANMIASKALVINDTITYINSQYPSGNYLVGIDTPTVGKSINATLYFGKTAVFPKLDAEFTQQELKDWGQRTVDPTGSMGGSLVDGAVVSERSPVNSFVYDAFTQVNQGGRGIHIINNGYAQLVSVFTIFCSTAVEVDNGGIASITNSNANFGDYCLVAKGKGKLDFQGTIYNPAYPTYEQSGKQTVNGQYYPNGYWPQNAEVLAYIPDISQRPHIGQVMEVVPPKYILTDTTGAGNFVETLYTNEQGLPGFLNAAPNLATLTTGTIKLNGIVTDGIAIGHTVYIRDQFGSFTDSVGTRYCAEGTTVTDIGYQSVTLSVALPAGGGEIDNPNFFTLLFCGNAYYNVLSSRIVDNPVTPGNTLIPGQATAELSALTFMSTLVVNVVAATLSPSGPLQLNVIQNVSNASGAAANSFISDRFGEIISIAVGGESVAPATRKTGTPPPGATQAIVQLRANKDFIVAEVTQKVINDGLFVMNERQTYKCKRDTALIIDKLILDLTNGGNYNSVMSGLSYYSRSGTHHIISLEDQVRNPLLFPDGATINFYQRSYMSALGYTFEYVGAGTNYGSLPQVGRADPVQSREVIQIDNGKVFFTSTDQNGDFRIGPGLVISQATGVLSGRTFTKSLFAQMTPFILAVEAGG